MLTPEPLCDIAGTVPSDKTLYSTVLMTLKSSGLVNSMEYLLTVVSTHTYLALVSEELILYRSVTWVGSAHAWPRTSCPGGLDVSAWRMLCSLFQSRRCRLRGPSMCEPAKRFNSKAACTHTGFLPDSDPAPVVEFFTRTGITAAGGQHRSCTRCQSDIERRTGQMCKFQCSCIETDKPPACPPARRPSCRVKVRHAKGRFTHTMPFPCRSPTVPLPF
jgi:hypothetical protein